MSALLGDWIRALVGAAVFCTIALALCPKGRARRVLNMACACVMALALLSPIAGLDMTSLSKAIGRYSDAAREITDSAEASAEEYEQTVIARECEAYISDRAGKLGVELSAVRVTLRWSEEGYWYPWTCTISAPGGRSGALSDAITGELGIPPERQSWEVAQ